MDTRQQFENDPAVIFLLDPDLRIVYCNLAWDRFAAENGGRGLQREHQVGRSVMDVVAAPLHRFFADGYRKAFASGQPWEHSYECSSPTVYRKFRMGVYRDPSSDGLVVVNSLVVERPHDHREPSSSFPNPTGYVDPHGITTMCCHCRRVSRTGQSNIWDWVPAYLEQPQTRISHSICDLCMHLYYPSYVE